MAWLLLLCLPLQAAGSLVAPCPHHEAAHEHAQMTDGQHTPDTAQAGTDACSDNGCIVFAAAAVDTQQSMPGQSPSGDRLVLSSPSTQQGDTDLPYRPPR